MHRTDFSYRLPPGLIAQHPLPERGASRLLCLDGASGDISHHRFGELLDNVLFPIDLTVQIQRYKHAALEIGKDGLSIANR